MFDSLMNMPYNRESGIKYATKGLFRLDSSTDSPANTLKYYLQKGDIALVA